MTDCPSEETLAAFLDGRLDPEARSRVLEHLADCGEDREVVYAGEEIGRLGVAEGEGADVPEVLEFRSRTRYGWAAIGSVAAAAVLVVALNPIVRHGVLGARDARAPLVAASGELEYRPVDGWLTGGFRHRPHKKVLRGPGDQDFTGERYQLQAAVGEVVSAAAKHPTVESMHASGVGHLMVGEREEAVRTLEDAVRRSAGKDELTAAIASSKDAELLTDLSVAYYARGKSRDGAMDFTSALDTAERAWHLKQTPEIAWNRAIAVSHFPLRVGAERAWDDFLRIARDPKWREEAKRRRAELSQSTSLEEWDALKPQLAGWLSEGRTADFSNAVSRYPALARQHFEEESLPDWARAQQQNRDDREERHDVAGALARSLASLGESLPLDAMNAIDRACTVSRCDEAASLHLRFAHARGLFAAQEYDRAALEFEYVGRDFARIRSPYELVAVFERLVCSIHLNDFGTASREGTALLSEIDHGRYRTLLARTQWLVGLCELQALRPEEALQLYLSAERSFDEGRDDAYLAAIRVRIADALEFVGEPDKASGYRLRAMAGMHHSGEQKDYGLTAFEAGYAALDRGHPNAAEAFFQETILFARATRRPDLGAMAALWRAVTFSRAGDFEAVSEQTRLAQDFLQTIESPAARARVSASAGAILGPAKITARPREVLSEAIDFFDRTGARTWLPQLLHQRAIVEEREGDRESAERDLRRAITVAEDVLGQGATAEARYGFSAEVHAIYSELIGLLLRNDRGEEALDVAERSRLITRRRPTTRRPVLKIAADLPHSTSVAVYEMQPTSVVVWTLSRGEVRMFQSPATPREIVHLTEGWNAKGPSLDALADLYDALMRPWAPEMAGGELVIIPAPGLETVPYAALYDRDARRHILDDFVVTVRTCLADVAGLDLPAGSDVGRVLIVADAEYRRMERLPESRREASQVNALHPGSVMLLGEEATGPRFLSELTQATALHFAGHATVNEVAPEMSALVVTGTGGDDDGRIYVHQLLNRSLPLRLVVLSACSTARTRTGDVRGNVTIARAFLDGGAAAVVATLWPVSDDDAATFSIRFHENLRAGATPAVAVRLAQLYVRAHTSSAAAWAAFCVMQGAA